MYKYIIQYYSFQSYSSGGKFIKVWKHWERMGPVKSVQFHSSAQSRLLRAVSRWILKMSKYRNSTASVNNSVPSLITLFFPYVYTEVLLWFKPFAPCPVTEHHSEEPGSILPSSHQIFTHIINVPSKTSICMFKLSRNYFIWNFLPGRINIYTYIHIIYVYIYIYIKISFIALQWKYCSSLFFLLNILTRLKYKKKYVLENFDLKYSFSTFRSL